MSVFFFFFYHCIFFTTFVVNKRIHKPSRDNDSVDIIAVDAIIINLIVLLSSSSSEPVLSSDPAARQDVTSLLHVVFDVKPGFHSNAIACVGKQPIMVVFLVA